MKARVQTCLFGCLFAFNMKRFLYENDKTLFILSASNTIKVYSLCCSSFLSLILFNLSSSMHQMREYLLTLHLMLAFPFIFGFSSEISYLFGSTMFKIEQDS